MISEPISSKDRRPEQAPASDFGDAAGRADRSNASKARHSLLILIGVSIPILFWSWAQVSEIVGDKLTQVISTVETFLRTLCGVSTYYPM